VILRLALAETSLAAILSTEVNTPWRSNPARPYSSLKQTCILQAVWRTSNAYGMGGRRQ
jgi:hypothetical protein